MLIYILASKIYGNLFPRQAEVLLKLHKDDPDKAVKPCLVGKFC